MSNSPTGRNPSGPEMQFLGTRTGRWSSARPKKSQIPRSNKVEVRFVDQPKSSLVDMDFADLELRVAAAFGPPGRFYSATAQRHVAEKMDRLLEMTFETAILKIAQTRIDEEGCGPFFAAMVYQ